MITGKNYIGNVLSSLGKVTFKTFNPQTNTENEIVCTSLNLLFNEKDNKLYKSRFSTKFSLEEFHKMFDDNNWEITVFNDGETESFIAENKTKRSISILQEEIFVLF